MNFEPKNIALPNGVTLQYVEHGDKTGTPVVLLHGVTDSWHSFELLMPLLPPDLRSIAFTMRGHGDSSRPETGYSFGDMAADLKLVLDALEIPAVVLVGHSMGSSNAQRFAIDHPDRTLGLVLMGTGASLRSNAAVQSFWNDAIRDLTDPVPTELAREFQLSTTAQPVPPEFIEMAVRESLKLPAAVWRQLFGGMLEVDHTPELKQLRTPCLLLWGDQDAFFGRRDQDETLAAIPGSRLVVLEGTGHAPHWEQPAHVAEQITSFVREIAEGTSARSSSAAD